MNYSIYTDGACSNNGAKDARGGFAFVVLDDKGNHRYEYSKHVENATNNICELSAVFGACSFFDAYSPEGNMATIYSDSAYIINCITQKWYKKWQTNGWRNAKKEPVANRELWERLIPYFENPRFSFEKVKGHFGEKDWNDYVDKLAVEAKEEKCDYSGHPYL